MAYRTLEMTLISAKDLKDVNFFSRMEVYVVASIAGDPRSRQRTPADREGGRNPTWNYTLRFAVPDNDPGSLMLHLLLRSQRILGDRNVGEVHVPVRELLDAYNAASAAATAAAAAEGGEEKKPAPVPPAQFLTYQVMKTSSGKTKGVLNLSYKFSNLIPAAVNQQNFMEPFPAYPPPASSSKSDAPVTAYPAAPGAFTAYPPPGGYPPQGGYGGYPAALPSQDGYGGYPAPPPQDGGYGSYPTPPPQGGGYGGYPPQPQGGYGYGCPPPAGPYGYGAPPPQPAKKNKFGMGLGAGLLGGAIGGMLLGDMVSDAAAYDAGYDAGFDDGMDF